MAQEARGRVMTKSQLPVGGKAAILDRSHRA
jgi:hypothetical protein